MLSCVFQQVFTQLLLCHRPQGQRKPDSEVLRPTSSSSNVVGATIRRSADRLKLQTQWCKLGAVFKLLLGTVAPLISVLLHFSHSFLQTCALGGRR